MQGGRKRILTFESRLKRLTNICANVERSFKRAFSRCQVVSGWMDAAVFLQKNSQEKEVQKTDDEKRFQIKERCQKYYVFGGAKISSSPVLLFLAEDRDLILAAQSLLLWLDCASLYLESLNKTTKEE